MDAYCTYFNDRRLHKIDFSKFVGTIDSHVGYIKLDFTQIIFLLIS